MKKLLLILLLLLSWTPYLFLATSVDKVPHSGSSYNCTVVGPERMKSLIGFGSVYYDTGKMLKNKVIILPYFNVDEDVFTADCGSKQFVIGSTDYIKTGDKINVFTETRILSFLGKELLREDGIMMFGTGWNENENEK